MYKAIFIDIDGTLRDSNKNISKRTIEAIRNIAKQGILVILCSGRAREHTENVSKQCNASKYIITSNGGNIYDYDDNKDIYVNIMNKKACFEIYEIAKEADAQFIMNVGADAVNASNISDIKEFIKNEEIVQCLVADTDFEKIKKLKSYIEKIENIEIKNQHKSLIDENAPREGTIYYDIANIESNKGNAIQKFCEKLNIDLKETIVIGDGENDIPMFKIAGYNVVMRNANDKVKEYADEITKSNDEDGVAVFLEKLINKDNMIELVQEHEKFKLRFYKQNKKIIETDAYIGKNGMTLNKTEGDLKTPKGISELGIKFGMHDIKLEKYIKINKDLYWVDDITSKYYNKLVDITKVEKDWNSAEHLIDYPNQYEYSIEIKSNPENIPSKGSAIFLHCSVGRPTAGCIAIDKENMKKILDEINEKTIIKI